MTFHSQSVFYRNKPATVSFSAEVYNVKPDGGNIPAASGGVTNCALKVLYHSLRKKKDRQKNGSGTLWSLFAVKKNTKKIVHQSVNIMKLFKTVSFRLLLDLMTNLHCRIRIPFPFRFRLRTKWIHCNMQNVSHCAESDSDSNLNCRVQELAWNWDWNLNLHL